MKPIDNARLDLRYLLRSAVAALFAASPPDQRIPLVRQAWSAAASAGQGDDAVCVALRTLYRDLREGNSFDRVLVASQFSFAAERL